VRVLKPETEIRNLRREVSELRKEKISLRTDITRFRREADLYLTRALAAEKKVSEWEERFDALLYNKERDDG